jgi:hypothetical protein
MRRLGAIILKIISTLIIVGVLVGFAGFAMLAIACGGASPGFFVILGVLLLAGAGRMIFAIFRRRSSGHVRKDYLSENMFSPDNDAKKSYTHTIKESYALSNYINEAYSRGVSKKDVIKNLRNVGWGEKTIKQIFGSLK